MLEKDSHFYEVLEDLLPKLPAFDIFGSIVVQLIIIARPVHAHYPTLKQLLSLEVQGCYRCVTRVLQGCYKSVTCP